MDIIFLGTNGWYDSVTGNTICTLISSDKYHIILDAGNGIHKADCYIQDDKPVYLFLSHFHLDHIEGLHILNKFRFSGGLNIFGQMGTKDVLNTIINKPFTVPMADLPFSVGVHELSEGHYRMPFSLECRFLMHSVPCLGFRFELEGKAVAYCPDTGICENAVRLAKGADLLIAESAFRPGEESQAWPHLSPQTAAQIACRAQAKRLALTHFDAERYKTIQERLDAAKTALDFDGLVVACDGMVLRL